MKVLLVSPKARLDEAMKNGTGYLVAQVSLAHVAALFPEDVEIQIIDEIIHTVPYDTDADIVGITVMTEVVEGAYDIADRFRRRGKPVIMGGIHATICPEEVKQHCDSVVIGEAEGQLAGLIDDFQNGRLKPYYRREGLADLTDLPIPRRDLLDKKKYRTVNCVQISRGCPNRCAFCVVPVLHGNKYRHRPVRKVVEELDGLEGSHLMFLDDNLCGKPAYAKELMREMAPLKKRFIGLASFKTLQDDEMLRLLAKAGGVGYMVGFESVSQKTLEAMGKRQKVEDFIDGIKRLHDHGMGLIGAFVFGMDTDGPEVFDQTLEFVEKSKIDIVQFTLLVPFPGTRVYDQYMAEGRMVDPQWWLNSNWNEVPFQPKLMSRRQLREGWIRAQKEAYSIGRIAKRVAMHVHHRPLFTTGMSIWLNWSYRAGLSGFDTSNMGEPCPATTTSPTSSM